MTKRLSALLLGAGLCVASTLGAQTLTIGSATGVAGGGTTPTPIPLTFTRNPANPVADFGVRISYPTAVLDAVVAGVNGGECANNDVAGFVTALAPPGQTDVQSNTYCNITFTLTPAASGTLNLTLSFPPGLGCVDAVPNEVPCDRVDGAITVVGGGGGGGAAPTVTYTPNPGTTINFPPGPAGNATSSITVTSAGGTVPGTVTVNNCSASAGFTITNAPINLTGTAGGSQINSSINLQCTRGGAVQNGTLTCTETPDPAVAGSPFTRTWPLVCPQATVPDVPPTLIYQPAPGNVTISGSVGSTVASTLDVSCDGVAGGSANCAGSGSGTARLQNVTVTGFSPSSLSCAFATEGGAPAASPLNFTAGQADPGDIRCTCLIPSVNQNYIVTATEIPNTATPGTTVLRQWNVTCGAGQVCGTISASPASGTVTLNNGGGPTLVTTVTTAGSGPGISRTVNCALSGISGATFNVTTSPSPLTIVGNGTGTVSATCSNSNVDAGTATLTCTSTSSDPQCPTLSATYTLSCPGVVPPPSVTSVPVPALGEQGRILLAALMLALGLVVVGFRLRG